MKINYSLIAVLLICAGCVETNVRDYTDSSHTQYKITSLAVLAISEDVGLANTIENSLISGLSQKTGIAVFRSNDILPPTRAYTIEEIKSAFLAKGISSLLIINVTDSTESSYIGGFQTFGRAYSSASGTAYTVGNTTYVNTRGSGTEHTTTIPVRRHRRDTFAYSNLFDISSTNLVWTAQTETNAGGKLFVTDTSTGGDISNTIIDTLQKKGHLPDKESEK